ncbi:hypothetical protein JTB14_025052 [Gonioctena quinquepunctata]|nr:hypothetical protein JTB14_025052 [Gonioctena quinquepunctata]
MDIGGHKEEPPDGEESEDGEILQKRKEEWPPPVERDPSQESKCEQGQTDLRFSHENKQVKSPEEQRGKIPLLIENVLKQETKSELGQTGQGPRPGYENVYIHGNPEGSLHQQIMPKSKKASLSWVRLTKSLGMIRRWKKSWKYAKKTGNRRKTSKTGNRNSGKSSHSRRLRRL